MREESKNKIKRYMLFAGIVLILTVVGSIIIKYYVEGEKNMPFKVSKIMVISSAQGEQQTQDQNLWNLKLKQTNDIYIDIAKNKNYKDTEIINKIVLKDIKVNTKPKIGNVVFYRAISDDKGLQNTSEEYIVRNNIEFKGAEKSDLTNLKIANQGGLILFRCINEDIGTYTAENTGEIKHDGTLLAKSGIQNEDIKFQISFNIEITLESGITYNAYIEQDLPIGNIVEQGVTNYQKEDSKDIVFKRV